MTTGSQISARARLHTWLEGDIEGIEHGPAPREAQNLKQLHARAIDGLYERGGGNSFALARKFELVTWARITYVGQ